MGLAEKRVLEVQASIEEEDGELLRMEAMVRPLVRHLPSLRGKVKEYEKRLRQAQINHNHKRIDRAQVELGYWVMERDNLDTEIKVRRR